MEAVMNGGAPAPVESAPVAAPDGAQPEAVQPAAAAPAAKPEGDEPRGVAKRIKELTDRIKASEAREAWYRDQIGRQVAPQAPPAEAEQVKSLKDFNYDETKFLEYSEQRLAARADKAAREAANRWRSEQEAITRRARFDERVEAYAKSVEDYHDVVTDATPVSEAMADAIMDSDEAGALMYYLGNNPDEARKLYYMSPAKAGRELQKLEDRLVSERKKAAEKPVTKAPSPAPRIESSGDPGTSVDPTTASSDELSDAEWARRRNKQLERRRK